jgi:hypothetical protein
MRFQSVTRKNRRRRARDQAGKNEPVEMSSLRRWSGLTHPPNENLFIFRKQALMLVAW